MSFLKRLFCWHRWEWYFNWNHPSIGKVSMWFCPKCRDLQSREGHYHGYELL